jgi:hypothetical protein
MAIMDELLEPLVVIGLFLLRLAVPLAITLFIGHLLRRLDARWETETQSHSDTVATQEPAAVQQPCWEAKECSARCPACRLTDIPCWLARLRVENRLPAECTRCVRFTSGTVAQTAPG